MRDRQWCQPGDDPTRRWVLLFEDPDVGLSVFDNEREAREAYERAILAWTCYLLAAAPRIPEPASVDTGDRAQSGEDAGA